MPRPTKKTAAIRIFSYLSDEERINQACELLARGVLRLAEKRGLTKPLHPKACERPEEIKTEKAKGSKKQWNLKYCSKVSPT